MFNIEQCLLFRGSILKVPGVLSETTISARYLSKGIGAITKLIKEMAMTIRQAVQPPDTDQPAQPSGQGGRLKFAGNNDFHLEVRRRIDEFFLSTGRRRRDCPQMYLKTAILLACFIASYVLLSFMAQTWWQALPLAIVLGLTTAAIGFNIQHDGGHSAYSNHAWVNRLMARTLDVIGGSSYQWHWKHAIFHHTYVNITGHDTDIVLDIETDC